MLQYTECTPKQVNTVYTSYENQARLKFQTENETENETWHFPGGLKEKVIMGSFVNCIHPVQRTLPTILGYIYKKKKKRSRTSRYKLEANEKK